MFKPKKGTHLTVELPGELMRVMVLRVIDQHNAVVVIDSQPVAKTHTYRPGDEVHVRRERGELGEVWRAVQERRVVPPPPKAAPAARAAR